MASSSSSQRQNQEFNALSVIEHVGKKRKVCESARLFDVFINHRGPDVKQTLATELYNALEQLGIRVFLDSQEKELRNSFPKTVETAIRSALVNMVIFSKGYAQSPWCLTELAIMLESKAKIIPIFYEVKPHDLRHIERGVYADAFIEYEKKGRHLEKLREWKEALQSLSFVAGEEFNSDWHCQNIVAAVQKELKKEKCLHVAKYPVGLNNLVEDFERRCLDELVQDFENQYRPKEGKHEGKVVGIFGQCGSGKTTLAKELFNRKRSNYSEATFLFDVREAYVTSQLPSLQLKLVKDLFHDHHPSFKSREEGTRYLKDHLRSSPLSSFIMVVDDVDHVEQLNALLVMDILTKNFRNSLVIVTTRDVGLLINAGITVGYRLKGIDRNDGRDLFCYHAFGRPYPCSGYEGLVDAFVDVCGGLPLSLQVLGRHVHGRDESYWRSELIKVSKTLHKDVRDKLKISFDALEDEEKQIFMDIACFFIAKETSIATRVWERSGWNAGHALETLKDKCLVEESLYVQQESVLRMHDHLRDLGREMALELSPPHRVWRPQDLRSLEFKGFKNILPETNSRCFHSFFDESAGSQVKFFLGEADSTPASLLWLEFEWNSEKQLSIPSWVPLQNLYCLKINSESLKKLFKNNSSIQAPPHLKELHITADVEAVGSMMEENELEEKIASLPEDLESLCWDGYPLKNLPSWLTLRNLKVLELHGANELEELWEEAHAPLQLRELTITGTWSASFERFPSSISNLNHLKKIALLGDVGKEFGIKGLPEEFCHLRSLEHLELRHCRLLSSLPDRFGDLRSLRYLDMCSCKELRILPDSFNQLADLQYLDLSGCKTLALQVDILRDITKLKKLYLSGCLKLRQLPHQITDQACLRELRLQDTRLEDVPNNIGQLSKLESLTIGSPFLTSLPVSLGDLSSLKSLSIIDCIDLESLPMTLGRLTLLEYLCIESSGVRSLPEGLTKLANLQTLKISGCPLSELNFGFGSSFPLWNLRVIEISETTVARISITEDCCPRLETLHISRNDYLEEIEILPTTVKNRELPECEKLKPEDFEGKLTIWEWPEELNKP